MTAPCWRCKGQGFVHGPCQACGALRTNRYVDGVLVASEVVYEVGSIWGDAAPPMLAKGRKRPKPGRP